MMKLTLDIMVIKFDIHNYYLITYLKVIESIVYTILNGEVMFGEV